MSSKTSVLYDFLKTKKCKTGIKPTHTRIGDTEQNIHGGSYTIKTSDELFLNNNKPGCNPSSCTKSILDSNIEIVQLSDGF